MKVRTSLRRKPSPLDPPVSCIMSIINVVPHTTKHISTTTTSMSWNHLKLNSLICCRSPVSVFWLMLQSPYFTSWFAGRTYINPNKQMKMASTVSKMIIPFFFSVRAIAVLWSWKIMRAYHKNLWRKTVLVIVLFPIINRFLIENFKLRLFKTGNGFICNKKNLFHLVGFVHQRPFYKKNAIWKSKCTVAARSISFFVQFWRASWCIRSFPTIGYYCYC